tara:strand:- start:311 stop:511 length:201 start_codon:yes stop_codon:yes gene_type:complete
MFNYEGGIITGEHGEPRFRCGECKAVNSMNKEYGKICKCLGCGDKNCKGSRKLRCEFCNYRYSEEY